MCLTLLFNNYFLRPQCEEVGAKLTNIQYMMIVIIFSFLEAMSNKDNRVRRNI